jgi:hypothetical protein
MPKRDIHVASDFFEYVRADRNVPSPSPDFIDVALLDMNHSWPNVGHDGIVHAVLDAAEEMRPALVAAGQKVRVISFDVRRTLLLPEPPNGRLRLYLGTGGPGHLDPRFNDGQSPLSQGIAESNAWERPLFDLFDAIAADREAALIGICHSFGLMCRWSGIAQPQPREEKSSGMPENVLGSEAGSHPWFRQFAAALPDRRHFKVIDNRLFDLVATGTVPAHVGVSVIAREHESSDSFTIVEFARDPSGTMPRILGVNHHPEIIDREHIMVVLEEKRAHGEVTTDWYRERATTMREMLVGDAERQSRLTSEYTFIGPLRFHLRHLIEERTAEAAQPAESLAAQ